MWICWVLELWAGVPGRRGPQQVRRNRRMQQAEAGRSPRRQAVRRMPEDTQPVHRSHRTPVAVKSGQSVRIGQTIEPH